MRSDLHSRVLGQRQGGDILDDNQCSMGLADMLVDNGNHTRIATIARGTSTDNISWEGDCMKKGQTRKAQK